MKHMEDRLNFEITQKGKLSEDVDKWREQFRDAQSRAVRAESELQRVSSEKNYTVEQLMLESVQRKEFEEQAKSHAANVKKLGQELNQLQA